MAYLGSITVPFQEFSFVVKIQCPERGVTGIRDSTVLDQKLASGQVTIDRMSKALRGWMRDPYAPSIFDGFAWNLSEAEEYDKMFPDHPLSRLRLELNRVQATLQIADDVKRTPRFEFAARREAKKPWWKFW
jgi:hypothetical protein